jgi:tetratricopeptide (TPR) repeat protein
VYEKVLGSDHPDTAMVLADLAKVLGDLGRNFEALKMHRKALRIKENRYGSNHPFLIDTLMLCGLYSALAKKFPEAELFLRRVIDIKEDDQTSDEYNDACTALRSVLRDSGRSSDVRALLNRGDFIYILGFAKLVVQRRSSGTLSILDLILGAAIAAKDEGVWAKEIGYALTITGRLQEVIASCGFGADLVSGGQPVFSKVLISEELRTLLKHHAHSSMQKFLNSLVTAWFESLNS